jgi:hypothetical protein
MKPFIARNWGDIMKRKGARVLLAALGLPFSLSMGVAHAGEKTLEFQLVTKYIEPRTLDAPNLEKQTITQAKAFGVAVFRDGRIGTKDYIIANDISKGAGTAFGYSTYTFDDGSVTARFTATAGSQGVHGEYTILAGTGAYAGAGGSGTFDSIPNPFTSTGLYKVKLKIVTP